MVAHLKRRSVLTPAAVEFAPLAALLATLAAVAQDPEILDAHAADEKGNVHGWMLFAAQHASAADMSGILPLHCDEQPEWRELRLLMEASPRSEPDDAPCAEVEGATELLSLSVQRIFDYGSERFEGWFGSGMFCTSCELLTDRPEDVFCTFGLLSALACVVRLCSYARKHYPEDWELIQERSLQTSNDGQKDPMCDLAFTGLTNMLFSASNFVELLADSGWPWTIRSIWQAIGEWNDISWHSDARVRGAVAAELARHDARRAELLGTQPALIPAGGSAIRIFALGMHRNLLKEPLLALKEVAANSYFDVVAPAGGKDLCEGVAHHACDERDPFFADLVEHRLHKHKLNSYQHMHSDRIDSLVDMRREFIIHFRESMQSANLLLCTEPLAYCTFFDGAGVPVISYMGNGAGFYVAPDPDDRRLLHETVYRMSLDPRNSFLAMNLILSMGLESSFGTGITTLTPMARYMGDARYTYKPESVPGMGKILITKRVIASWDIRCMTQMLFLRAQMWLGAALAREVPALQDYVSKWMPIPQVYQIGELKPEMQSYEVWSTFRAAIVLPWDPSGLNFYDLYALGLPLFVPDPVRVLPPFIFRFPNANRPAVRRYADDPNPPKPRHERSSENIWFDPGKQPWTFPYEGPNPYVPDGWNSFRAWSLLTDFEQMPHLRHFGALAELVPQLLDVEGLLATSRAMVAEHLRMEEESRRLWARVLARAWAT